MKRSTHLVYAAARVLFSSAVFYWFVVYILIVAEAESFGLSALYPLAGFAAAYLAGLFAASKELSFWPAAAIAAAVTAAGLAAMELGMDVVPDSLRLRVFSGFVYAVASGLSARAALKDMSAEQLTLRFDISIVLCALLLFTRRYLPLHGSDRALWLIIAAMVVMVTALTLMRSGTDAVSASLAGRAVPFVLLVLAGFVTYILYILGSGGAKSLADLIVSAAKAVWGSVTGLFVFLWTQWTRFCTWLASLFPAGEAKPQPENTVRPDQQIPDVSEPSEFAVIVIYVMTALLIIAAVVGIYLALRNIRFRRKSISRRTNRRAVRSGSASAGLKAALAKLKERLVYKLTCIRYRNTAAGLLAWCESKAPKGQEKLQGESGAHFLRRLSVSLAGPDAEALDQLASIVEQSFYSKKAPAVEPELCKRVKSCLRS